ncbi:MAG: tRNA (adenosine(37)-N6)-dimethylallyltransferase MiaA [Pseudomonadota bacterium]|nr:tRNA (adenosine(37)-N6)-dimethylallyltransferase MiaA [Pseudomonadota bacterium]
MKSHPPVVCLMGPTASGKTALAFELYDQGRFELVSVDSALIYRGMDIGTAKPTATELAQYPHHLVDILDPDQVYSAANFVEDTVALIGQIHARGKIPLLVGGTMLYFRSLLQGMAPGLPESDPTVRAEIEAEAAALGWSDIHRQLAEVDPRAAERFAPNDRQRLLRALEVYRLTGHAISDLHDQQTFQPWPFEFQLFALMPERAWLHQRIALRLELMWSQGFLNEVQQLRSNPNVNSALPSMRSVGYRQAWEYLDLVTPTIKDYQQMQDKALFATRQLAKRQYTWLRSLREQHEIDVLDGMNARQMLLRV